MSWALTLVNWNNSNELSGLGQHMHFQRCQTLNKRDASWKTIFSKLRVFVFNCFHELSTSTRRKNIKAVIELRLKSLLKSPVLAEKKKLEIIVFSYLEFVPSLSAIAFLMRSSPQCNMLKTTIVATNDHYRRSKLLSALFFLIYYHWLYSYHLIRVCNSTVFVVSYSCVQCYFSVIFSRNMFNYYVLFFAKLMNSSVRVFT